MMRDSHEESNEITETSHGDGTSLLECDCGWVYTAHDQFIPGVVKRHMMESDLLK